MNTTQHTVTQDPLGLKRFALTESAYDLINSLTGVYFRLRYIESKANKPDTVRISSWSERTRELNTIHGNGKWADLFFLEQLIADLSKEYKEALKQEEESTKHATENQPGPVHA
jgi:hypothetical protein